ncbi:MAG TPA: prolipoprotein diacylglyceryl transferase family protein [Gemmatimonadaceae bacterium]|nr:prolipoprotein diacylglyceryl transferase family protein [Gemmatimonadaceae bacterium]
MTLASPIIHHPFEISLGGFKLTGFGIAVLLAFLISQVITERELARRGHDKEATAVADVLFAALLGTMIGAKVYYVTIITHNIADLWSRGGFVFWGGFIGSVALCFATIKYKKLSFVRFADVAGIAIAAGYSIGRTGCWAVGDDYGRQYNGFLSVAFPNGAPPSTVLEMQRTFHMSFPAGVDPSTVVSVYPTQLLEVLLGFVMFMILWRIRDHKHAEGWLFGVYCVLAGVERFIVEFFRAKDDRFAWSAGLSMAQLIAIGVAIAGVAIMMARSQTGEGRPGIHRVPVAA